MTTIEGRNKWIDGIIVIGRFAVVLSKPLQPFTPHVTPKKIQPNASLKPLKKRHFTPSIYCSCVLKI